MKDQMGLVLICVLLGPSDWQQNFSPITLMYSNAYISTMLPCLLPIRSYHCCQGLLLKEELPLGLPSHVQ